MSNSAYIFSELNTLEPGKKVFIAREAQFVHRRGLTVGDLEKMKENFDNNVVQLDIDFDYDHKEDLSKGRKAAGWIKSLELGEVEVEGKTYKALFAVAEWTPAAEQAIKGREYKYTSPELFFEWMHPETGKKYKSVLRSVAILNRPQIPGQPAIELKEQNAKETSKKEEKMDKVKKFIEETFSHKFKDDEAVTEDFIIAKFSDLMAEKDESVKEVEKKLEDAESKFKTLEATKTETEKDFAKFKEEFDALKTERFAEKVASLVDKAKEKMPPAMADGMFKSLAEQDYDKAEKNLAEMDTMLPKSDKGTEGEGFSEDLNRKDEADRISKFKSEYEKANGRGITFAEAYSLYSDEKKGE